MYWIFLFNFRIFWKIMSQSLEALSNGWATDTTAPVDLDKPTDNEVSGPLRSCLCKIKCPLLTPGHIFTANRLVFLLHLSTEVISIVERPSQVMLCFTSYKYYHTVNSFKIEDSLFKWLLNKTKNVVMHWNFYWVVLLNSFSLTNSFVRPFIIGGLVAIHYRLAIKVYKKEIKTMNTLFLPNIGFKKLLKIE